MGRQGFQEKSKGSIRARRANVRTPIDLLEGWEQKRGFSTCFVQSFARMWDFLSDLSMPKLSPKRDSD